MGPIEGFFTSILNRLTIKGKLRLGFFLIPLLTVVLGYTGYVGMVRVKYATQHQAKLTQLTYLTFNLVHREESLLSHYQAQTLKDVNEIIEDLLKEEPQKHRLSLMEKIIYYTALMPREIKTGTQRIWNYIKDLILKVTSMNQFLEKRWKRDGPVDRVKAQGAILRKSFRSMGLDYQAKEIALLENRCVESPRPLLINRLLDRLETIERGRRLPSKTKTLMERYRASLERLKEIDAQIAFIHSRFQQILSTIQREGREGINSANALVAHTISLVFWETTTILFLALLASMLISWGITKNITAPMTRIVEAIKRARDGDFSLDIKLPPRKDEMGILAASFSDLLDRLRTNVGYIIEKSGEIIQSRVFRSPTPSHSSDPLTRARETVEALVKINKYKSLIEGDLDKGEIYRHLTLALEKEFGLKDYFILEMNESENRLEPIAGPSMERYSLDVLIQPSLCRVKRTGEVVNSLEFPQVCRHAQLKNGEFHICLPILMGGEVKGILRINGTQEERESILEDLPYIAKYIETTAPVVYASKLLEITREQSLRDGLTGLYNRRFLEGYLEKQVRFAQRKGFTMGFIMLDIDHFKHINDRYGHKAGDLILQNIAKIIEGSVRASDVVIRYGGEEFLVLLPEVTPEYTVHVAEKIRKNVETHQFTVEGEKSIKVTVSLGVAELPTHTDHPWEAIKFADVALYHAKREGRNRVVVFSPTMWQEMEELQENGEAPEEQG